LLASCSINAVDAHLARGLVDFEPIEAQEHGRCIHDDAAAPRERPYPRDQLARRERFAHVVVGAELEPDHAIDLIAARGDHHDRQPAAFAAQRAHDIEAVDDGEPHVEQQQVRAGPDGAQRRGPVARFRAAKSFARQMVDEQFANREVVFRDDDAQGGHIERSARALQLRFVMVS
jgi:hypothetical protein